MTLDKILKGFNKTLTQLETLATKNDGVVNANEQTIESLTATNTALNEETARANNVAAKIRELVS